MTVWQDNQKINISVGIDLWQGPYGLIWFHAYYPSQCLQRHLLHREHRITRRATKSTVLRNERIHGWGLDVKFRHSPEVERPNRSWKLPSLEGLSLPGSKMTEVSTSGTPSHMITGGSTNPRVISGQSQMFPDLSMPAGSRNCLGDKQSIGWVMLATWVGKPTVLRGTTQGERSFFHTLCFKKSLTILSTVLILHTRKGILYQFLYCQDLFCFRPAKIVLLNILISIDWPSIHPSRTIYEPWRNHI